MTKRISTKTLLCCDAHEWKQTLSNNLYELSDQPQQEWWNAKVQMTFHDNSWRAFHGESQVWDNAKTNLFVLIQKALFWNSKTRSDWRMSWSWGAFSGRSAVSEVGRFLFLFPSANFLILQDRINLHLFFSRNSPSAHASCSKVSWLSWVLMTFPANGWPWSNNQDHLLCWFGWNDYYCNNQCKVCLQTDVPHQPHVGFLSTWRQPRSCTNLDTRVFEGTHKLLNWHLQHWQRPWSCTIIARPFWRTFEQNLTHSSLVHDERDIHNNVSFEDLFWLQIVFPLYLEDNLLWAQSCPWYRCPQWPRPKIPDCWKAYQLLAHANLWVILLPFAKLHLENRCIWTFVFLVIRFPHKSNISCTVNSCVDWHEITLVWVASHQTIVLQ